MTAFVEGRPVSREEFEAAVEEQNNPWRNLESWWADKADEEIRPLVAKAQEYGGARRANDLIELGRELVQAGVVAPSGLSDESKDKFLAELGIWFYVSGKMARWRAAITEGRAVSDDTLVDIGIYIRMVQRIRAVGGWPI